ncbi:Asp-tRNA(Asn)/Glu-tRNA(Gln) amidotransferase subunit GatC [Patescibacteria group bacterium]|nr:Asp-tRNA(Asn)/Glu-tRNA(Gln) amidotransferase subunit GatC [Patescibacteria group bacterium]
MPISKKHIEHLAELARLDITEEEKEKYAEQISSILEYFEQLNEMDTMNVEPLAQVNESFNSLRSDEVLLPFSAEKTLAAAPQSEKNQIKVNAVFE